VAREFPEVELVTLARSEGLVARDHGVRRASTPYVAFSDDDSWWARAALERATRSTGARCPMGAAAIRTTGRCGSRGLPWVLKTRGVVPPRVEDALRVLDHDTMSSHAIESGE
jgi:Glycosyl transferase family 2